MRTPKLNEVNIYSWNLQDINDLDAYSEKQTTNLLYKYLKYNNIYNVIAFIDNKENQLYDFIFNICGSFNLQEFEDNIIVSVTQGDVVNNILKIEVENNIIYNLRDSKEYKFYLSRINIKLLNNTILKYNKGDLIILNQQNNNSLYQYCISNNINTINYLAQNLSDIKLKEFEFSNKIIFGNCYYKNYYNDPDNVVVKLNDVDDNKYTSVSDITKDFCYLLKKQETNVTEYNNYYEYIVNLFINSFRDFEDGNGFNFYGVSQLFTNDVIFNDTYMNYYNMYNLIIKGYRFYLKSKNYNLCFVLEFNLDSNNNFKIMINNYDINIKNSGQTITNSFKLYNNDNSIDIYSQTPSRHIFSIKFIENSLISFEFYDTFKENLLQCDNYYICFYEPIENEFFNDYHIYDDFHIYSQVEIDKMFNYNIKYINNYFKNCCVDNGVDLGNPIIKEPALIKDVLDLNKYSKVLVRFYDKDNQNNKFSTDFFIQKNNYSWKTDYIIISKLLITRGFNFFESQWFDSFNERLNKSEFCTLLAWNEEETTGNKLTFALDDKSNLHKFKEGVKLSEINNLIEDENITPNNN